MFKNALESLLKAIDVVVDQVLLVDLGLIDQTHQSQAFVHLSQVEHDVLVGIRVTESDKRARLFVELATATILVHSINTCHINQHVNELRTYLVVLHIDW